MGVKLSARTTKVSVKFKLVGYWLAIWGGLTFGREPIFWILYLSALVLCYFSISRDKESNSLEDKEENQWKLSLAEATSVGWIQEDSGATFVMTLNYDGLYFQLIPGSHQEGFEGNHLVALITENFDEDKITQRINDVWDSTCKAPIRDFVREFMNGREHDVSSTTNLGNFEERLALVKGVDLPEWMENELLQDPNFFIQTKAKLVVQEKKYQLQKGTS